MSQYTEQNKFALFRQLTFITDIVAFIQGNILEILDVRPPHPGLVSFLFFKLFSLPSRSYEYMRKLEKPLKELRIQGSVDLLDVDS